MIRIGAAQIPVTSSMTQNVQHIKTALDWAGKNQVNYLLTPEGSLSGYLNTYRDLETSNIENLLQDVVSYATSKSVCLALGTEIIKEVDFGKVKRSQIQYYDDTGFSIGEYNKQMTIPGEHSYPGSGPEIIKAEGLQTTGSYKFNIGSLICNDMWGQRDDTQILIRDLFYYTNSNVDVIFHASNGFRGQEAGDEEANKNLRKFSDMHLWMASRYRIPIVTVDNCYKMDGEFYDGPTSSTSGIIHNGEWLVKAKPNGIDYFYYDFNF